MSETGKTTGYVEVTPPTTTTTAGPAQSESGNSTGGGGPPGGELLPPPPPPPPPTSLRVAITLFLYCLSGTLLTLVNKVAIVSYPFANNLLLLQNGMTIVLLILGSFIQPSFFQTMPKITPQLAVSWLPLVLMFVGMLLSSLLALQTVSAVTLIVMRNISTLVTAAFEWVWLKEIINSLTWACLIGILLSAIVFAFRDITFDMVGYFWLLVNVISTSSYQIYVKGLIKTHPNLGPFGMSYVNNVISMPIFLLVGLFTGELPSIMTMFTKGPQVGFVLFLSGLLGFALSTTAFMMNKMITATSMMVANNVNKFAVIVLSEIFVQRTLDDVASLGALLVLGFGWLYSRTKSADFEKSLPPWAKTRTFLVGFTTIGLVITAGAGVTRLRQDYYYDSVHTLPSRLYTIWAIGLDEEYVNKVSVMMDHVHDGDGRWDVQWKDMPDATEINQYDAIMCSPSKSCDAFVATNKSMVVVATWKDANAKLVELARLGQAVVIAHSPFDVNMCKTLVHVEAHYVPPFMGDSSDDDSMAIAMKPMGHQILRGSQLSTGHFFGKRVLVEGATASLLDLMRNARESTSGARSLEFIGDGHIDGTISCAIHFPHSPIVTHQLLDHYSRDVPIFVPSLSFLMELQGNFSLMTDFNDMVKRETNGGAKGNLEQWMGMGDYYVGDQFHTFDSLQDLIHKLMTFNVYEYVRMAQHDRTRVRMLVKEGWEEILSRLDPTRRVMPTKNGVKKTG